MKIDSTKLQKLVKEAAERQAYKEQLIQAFTSENLKSRPSKEQLELLIAINTPRIRYRTLRAGNQAGKTTLAVREVTWMMENTHPYWEKPNGEYCHICKSKDFATEGVPGAETFICNKCDNIFRDWSNIPFCGIISSTDRSKMDSDIWAKRIKPLLTKPHEWREIRNPLLTSVRNKTTGAEVLFIPHSYSIEKARELMQGYTVQHVWIDELAPIDIMEELARRVDAYQGYLLHTFTPKGHVPRLRRWIEDQVRAGVALELNFEKWANPIYVLKEYEQSKLAGATSAKRATVEKGDWGQVEGLVYSFYYDKMTVEFLPEGYNRAWPHVVSLDPAMVNKMGFMICTLDRITGVWYTVKAFYIDGDQAPSARAKLVHDLCKDYNIVVRVSDAEHWFTRQSHLDYPEERFIIPFNIKKRKKELIKAFQEALSNGGFKILREHIDFIDEITTCKLTPAGDNIIHATKYHLIDCGQYFVDTRPLSIVDSVVKTYAEEIREHTKKVAEKEAQQKESKNKPVIYDIKRAYARLGRAKKGRRGIW